MPSQWFREDIFPRLASLVGGYLFLCRGSHDLPEAVSACPSFMNNKIANEDWDVVNSSVHISGLEEVVGISKRCI